MELGRLDWKLNITSPSAIGVLPTLEIYRGNETGIWIRNRYYVSVRVL
jgi:hypothetical protein